MNTIIRVKNSILFIITAEKTVSSKVWSVWKSWPL